MELKTKDFTKIKFNNQRFSLTNGKIFLLGILEENAIKDEPVLTTSSESREKELFNPIFSILKVNDQLLSPKFQKPISHLQSYNLEEDILYRTTTYLIDGSEITIKSERFLDKRYKIIYTHYEFKTSDKMNIDFYHGIDDTRTAFNQDVVSCESKHQEISLKTSDNEYIVLMYDKNFRHKNYNSESQPTEHYSINTDPDRIYSITKMIGYGPNIDQLKKSLKRKLNLSYEKVREKHIQYKKSQFKQNHMTIVNNDETDILLSYIYRQHYNKFSPLRSLNQTGLEDYTQIIFYLFNKPEMAKQVLKKRIKMLKKYKSDAKQLGYQGAIIIDHLEAFSLDDKRIYRGALLIYLIELYQQMTNDFSLLEEGALELSIEICRFYIDYSELSENNKHYYFNDVSNLNKTLNHIDNHTFTNYLIRKAMTTTKSLVAFCQKSKIDVKYPKNELSEDIRKFNALHRKIYIPKIDDNQNIYPYQQFDADLEKHRLNRKDNTVNIMFDQLLILVLFNKDFSIKTINHQIEYFSKLSKGYQLNQMLLKLISSDIIRDSDFSKFLESVSVVDKSLLANENGLDFGLMGMVYVFMTYRLSALRFDGFKFTVDSLIPKNIRRIEYDIKYHQYTGSIKIKRNSAQLDWNY